MENIFKGILRQHHINRQEKRSKIKDEKNVPCTQWRIEKISKLVIGKDAQVRGAELVDISKTGEKTVCQHPVRKLIPFVITTDNH